MDNPRKQFIVLSILGVLVAASWIHGLTAKPSHSGRLKAVQASRLEAQAAGPAVPEPLKSRYPQWGGNPFEIERKSLNNSAPDSSPRAAASHVVSGILWDPQTPSAIVDGHLVNIGSELDGWHVVEIHKDRVILSDGSDTRILTVE